MKKVRTMTPNRLGTVPKRRFQTKLISGSPCCQDRSAARRIGMHLIHVPIVASAVPPPLGGSRQRTGSLQRPAQQAFHDSGDDRRIQKTKTISRLLPLFASHA